MALPRFEYLAPRSLDEACALLVEHKSDARLLAGGTDLLLRMGRVATATPPKVVIGLRQIPGLDGLAFDAPRGLTLGALARLADVSEHEVVRERYTALAQAAAATATVQIRNMGSVVGNLCNASPSADTATPLLVHDAEVVIVRSEPGSGALIERTLPLDKFFLGPGRTALGPTELVRELRVPSPGRGASDYQRISERSLVDIAAVCVSVFLSLGDDGKIATARVALGAVAPTPMRVPDAEQALVGAAPSDELFAEAGRLAKKAARPISDVRAAADYRTKMVEVLTTRACANALARARASREVRR